MTSHSGTTSLSYWCLGMPLCSPSTVQTSLPPLSSSSSRLTFLPRRNNTQIAQRLENLFLCYFSSGHGIALNDRTSSCAFFLVMLREATHDLDGAPSAIRRHHHEPS
ncbi:phosphate ABC transporter permease protein PstA [Sesbania bispinosa]|nr:phosphate ABC transporter permease protein PstA [Sesbania bispinosa]